eukprot:647126-Rhodomonas_salina.1
MCVRDRLGLEGDLRVALGKPVEAGEVVEDEGEARVAPLHAHARVAEHRAQERLRHRLRQRLPRQREQRAVCRRDHRRRARQVVEHLHLPEVLPRAHHRQLHAPRLFLRRVVPVPLAFGAPPATAQRRFA